ncbi:IS66 family transposase [Caproicibacter fermentans]|uniref:Transposase n=1 Tax=Caproicibacter fermentans TaxID=2576756 RepID=A0A7G8TGE5_9FIRM|nr:transposase [Caproicibacter fermentans]
MRYFEYQPDRSGKHAAAFLKDFTGFLVTDGYAGYHIVDNQKQTQVFHINHVRLGHTTY